MLQEHEDRSKSRIIGGLERKRQQDLATAARPACVPSRILQEHEGFKQAKMFRGVERKRQK
jgi:hypothetical protein